MLPLPFRRAYVIACRSTRTVFLAAMMLASVGVARADWTLDGVPVCTAPEVQDGSWTVVGDALFVVWTGMYFEDYSTRYRVHAQRLDASGNRVWSANGVPIAAGNSEQWSPMAVPDGVGGLIVAFIRGHDLYSQRLDANGVPQWGVDGIPIARGTTSTIARLRGLIPDGATPLDGGPAGAIVLWTEGPWSPSPPDNRMDFTVHAQAIDGFGHLRWNAAGVQLSADDGGEGTASPRKTAVIVSDGSGAAGGPNGAFVAWRSHDGNLLAQRLTADGVPHWMPGGLALTDLGSVEELEIVGTAPGKAVVLWSDSRDDLFARELSSIGPGWAANGVPIAGSSSHPISDPRAIADGAEGVFVFWMDARDEARLGYDIYAQHIDPSGVQRWAAGGVSVCAREGHQFFPDVVPDGAGGVIATWTDSRTGVPHIQAQRLDSGGSPLWTADGVPVCTAWGGQSSPSIVADGAGGAYVSWTDTPRGRRNTMLDIYAQHLSSTGGPAARRLLLSSPTPNPSQGPMTCDFAVPSVRRVSAAIYGVDGALVRTLMRDRETAAGRGTLRWDGRDEHGRAARSGVFFMRLQAGIEVEVRKVVVTR